MFCRLGHCACVLADLQNWNSEVHMQICECGASCAFSKIAKCVSNFSEQLCDLTWKMYSAQNEADTSDLELLRFAIFDTTAQEV